MFGKDKERLRQWSLLGALLRRTGLLEALEFMGLAFGGSAVPWLLVRAKASAGGSLSEIAARLPASDAVLSALKDGEERGRLAESLEALAVAEDARPFGEVDDGAVVEVDRRLSEARGRFTVPPGPLARRLCVMAGQPYWAPKAGTFRVRSPKGDVEVRIAPGAQGAVEVELAPPSNPPL
jgi:hypothetical protein